MANVDPNYPVFVLSLCVFNKRYYSEQIVPALEKFKFRHFGHDLVVLHEHEIRKEKGVFTFFRNREHKQQFLADLTSIIETSNFILISCVIDKDRLRAKEPPPPEYEFLQEKGQEASVTHVAVECRGKKEDNDLELEFRRICDGANRLGLKLPFQVLFADKKVNSSGLQLADLVARPIGLGVLRPDQDNRAFDVLKRKFFCRGGRENAGQNFENWGLKIYPTPESEKPR